MRWFSRRSSWPVAWERKPWWRALSLSGWTVVALGLFATFGFVLGVCSGTTLLVLPSKTPSSPPIDVSFHTAPVLFCVVMLVNLLIATVVWGLLFQWLKERR